MGFKSFITKKALQMKGVSKEKAEEIAEQLDKNPEIAKSLKTLEGNKEVKELFEKITKEIEEKKKGGLAEQYAAVLVMGKYKAEIMKHREALEPLMGLMQK
jgi:GTPase SAR1 family protein